MTPTSQFYAVGAAKESKVKDVRNYQNHREQITWSTNMTRVKTRFQGPKTVVWQDYNLDL